MARAAGSTSLNVVSTFVAFAGLTRTAMRAAPGTNSRSSPSRFAVNSPMRKLMPVKLAPGRPRLDTRPSLTGSSPTMKTMGIVAVAALAANAVAGPPFVSITATRRRTSSAPSAGSRSNCPSAQRYSIDTFSPLNIAGVFQTLAKCAQLVRQCVGRSGVKKSDHRHRWLLPSRALHLGREQQAAATEQCNELTPLAVEHRGLPPPCASAADWPLRSVFRTPSLPQGGPPVLGPNLNCSESRRWPAPHCASNQARIAAYACAGTRCYVFKSGQHGAF